MGFFRDVMEDIDSILEKDPAARTRLEIFLCYPGIRAVIWHRPAHWMYNHNIKLLARMLSQRVRRKTGIEIHPGAKIGRRCFIDHGMAVVIGETTEIGDDVTIYQAVTLGGTGKESGKRHPTIGNNVIISSGARVLGPFTVGDNSKIGSGAVVLNEVPPNCTVVGIPGRIVKRNNVLIDDMNQIDLPDPVKAELDCLRRRIISLEDELNAHRAMDERLYGNCGDCGECDISVCSDSVINESENCEICGSCDFDGGNFNSISRTRHKIFRNPDAKSISIKEHITK